MRTVPSLQRERIRSGSTYLAREPADRSLGFVLLVHGLGSSAQAWLPVVGHAPEQAGLLIPDLPGFGDSPSSSAPPLEAATEMLNELLDRYLDEARVTVVAHSVGAIVAMRALEGVESDNLEQVVLVSGTLLTASTVASSVGAALADPALTAMVGVHVMAGVIPLNTAGAAVIAQHPSLRAAFLWPFLAAPRQVGREELMAALPHPGGRESVRAIWSARDIDLSTLMVKNRFPTRIVHGRQDRLIDQQDVATACDLLHTDDVVELDGCGHWPHIERPAQTAAAAFAK